MGIEVPSRATVHVELFRQHCSRESWVIWLMSLWEPELVSLAQGRYRM